jgi:hypothetical protein
MMKERMPKKERMIDMVSISRLNYVLYCSILLVSVVVIYFAVAEYMMYARQQPTDYVTVSITRNDVDNFADGFHPFVVMTAGTEASSMIEIEMTSAAYSARFSSGEYVTNYTAFAILPKKAYSTEFNITATATDKNGVTHKKHTSFKTKPEPEAVFKIG